MKRFNLRNLLALVMLILFASCKENDGLDTNLSTDTDFINFGFSEATTKTSYDATDKLRINWENGDKVKISCEQSQGAKESVYEVLRSTTATNEGTLQGVSSGLLAWNPNAGDHTFYGAYPGESATITGSQITCKCAVNQTLTTTASGDNVYTPDMKNACMVAKSTAKQTSLPVKLDFVPAFTALDIEIPVSSDGLVTLTSLTVTLDNRSQYISTDGEFILDCSDLASGYTFIPYSGAPSSIGFSANISSIIIGAGKKAVITLLLPPVTIAANSATITAVLDGTSKTTAINTEIAGGTRRTIKMGEFTSTPTGTNPYPPQGFNDLSYYQWDAYCQYNPYNYSEKFGEGKSGFNDTKPAVATHSCVGAPTYEDAKIYLGNGVYWDTKGPTYKLPDGNTYTNGLWVKKWNYCDKSKSAEKVVPKSGFSSLSDSERSKYFFLPACGLIDCAIFSKAATEGYYWLCEGDGVVCEYGRVLKFNKAAAEITLEVGGMGIEPLVGFDETYPTIIQSMTLSPSTLSTVKGGQYETLTATVIMSDGSTPTSGFGWTINPENVLWPNHNLYINDWQSYYGNTFSLAGYNVGTAKVTVTYRGESRTAIVKVTAINSMILSHSTLIVKRGQSETLTATVTLSDGSTPTSDFTWKINSPTGVVTGTSTTTNTISLTGVTVGTTEVTVNYKGWSKTATVTVVDSMYTKSNYYMWDAPVSEPYNFPNINNNTPGITATQSCNYAPTYEDAKIYLGNGVYWDTKGPVYILPDGNTYTNGLWVKKWDYCDKSKSAEKVDPKSGFSSLSDSERSKYFFLPACGYYESTNFNIPGTSGYYWLSTSKNTGAYRIKFSSGTASVDNSYLTNGFVPMPRL